MKDNKGYQLRPLSINRQAVVASASTNRRKNIVNALTEVDISVVRAKIRKHAATTGEKLSLTA
jgi:hypothetical protein